MSAVVEQAARRPRRRGEGNAGRRRKGPREPKAENAAPKEAAAPREKRERPESIPVPAEWAGQTKTGVVSTVIRKGRVKFGFIHICPGPEIDEKTPRIYFSFGTLPNDTQMRRGYVVTFKISKDDQDRLFAENVALTPEGVTIAAKREEEIAAKRAERAANPPAPAEKKEKAPREKKEKAARPPREPREPREEKPVNLQVTCEGHSETKSIIFNQNASIGKMKRTAVDAFGCDISFQIYAGSEFLTKTILNGLKDGDKIRLAAPTETKA